jgi:hypothetical protein
MFVQLKKSGNLISEKPSWYEGPDSRQFREFEKEINRKLLKDLREKGARDSEKYLRSGKTSNFNSDYLNEFKKFNLFEFGHNKHNFDVKNVQKHNLNIYGTPTTIKELTLNLCIRLKIYIKYAIDNYYSRLTKDKIPDGTIKILLMNYIDEIEVPLDADPSETNKGRLRLTIIKKFFDGAIFYQSKNNRGNAKSDIIKYNSMTIYEFIETRGPGIERQVNNIWSQYNGQAGGRKHQTTRKLGLKTRRKVKQRKTTRKFKQRKTRRRN